MLEYKSKIEKLIEDGATVEKIQEEVKKANQDFYKAHCKNLAYTDNVFSAIYENNTINILSFNEKTRILDNNRVKKVKSSDVETEYRLRHSKATNPKNGNPLANNDVTIFGDFKLHCALHSFIKKCNNQVTKEVYTFDKKLFVDKTKVLDFSDIMDSKTALDKAINTIVSLVGINATYKKKYNDVLIHFATKQVVNGKGITIKDTSIYALIDYIIECCQDRVTVKLSYMQEKKQK